MFSLANEMNTCQKWKAKEKKDQSRTAYKKK